MIRNTCAVKVIGYSNMPKNKLHKLLTSCNYKRVIDSTGSGHKDSQGNTIPDGVQIRPFTRDSWYWQDFDHAHRIVTELSRVTRGPVPELPEGGADQIGP